MRGNRGTACREARQPQADRHARLLEDGQDAHDMGRYGMQQLAVSEVADDAVTLPADVLRALGVSNGDKVAFVRKDDGSISLTKAPPTTMSTAKRPISDFVGIFSTGEKRSWEEDLAMLHEIRYGDEEPPPSVFGDTDADRR